jgi:hypothetical protein
MWRFVETRDPASKRQARFGIDQGFDALPPVVHRGSHGPAKRGRFFFAAILIALVIVLISTLVA